MKKIAIIVGARPNFVKASPLVKQLKKIKIFDILLIHTGQHYDSNMSKIFFKDLGLPAPDVFLGIGGGTHTEQTAKIMIELEKKLTNYSPDLVVVVGDVNSTLAGAIVSKKLNIKLAHIEAGLRSRDMTMPEEVNRIVTDAISDYLFTTCKDADDNLLQEGHSRKKIFFVGNLMIDSLIENISKNKSDILKKLKLKSNEYCIITLHRPSNVDDSNNLKKYLELVNSIQKKITVVFPIHPRTLKMLKTYQLDEYIKTFKNFVLTEPLGYIDFIKLLLECKFILTDSGGIQEEASYLKIPCLTLRKNTERPITITEGTNTLVGDNFKLINSIIKQILNNNYKKSKNIKYWDGKAALRISNILKKLL